MPTALIVEGFRFFFYSNEGKEPPHVHVEYGDGKAKFWLDPVAFDSSRKMKAQDLRRARELAEENVELLKERWNEHHGA